MWFAGLSFGKLNSSVWLLDISLLIWSNNASLFLVFVLIDSILEIASIYATTAIRSKFSNDVLSLFHPERCDRILNFLEASIELLV